METTVSNVYDASCPTRYVLDLIADKWATLIIMLLKDQPLRFAALQRKIDGISQKMLTQTLRRLERNGLVQRTVYAEVPPRVEYALTPLGRTLYEPFDAIVKWTQENVDAMISAQQCYDERS